MDIPAVIIPLIAEVRQQHHQLKDAPDEVVAQIIMQALAAQQCASPLPNPGEVDIESMSAGECGVRGERLFRTGEWQTAERFFFATLEKAEQAGDLDLQGAAARWLGRHCQRRGDFPQALALFQQALRLAKQQGNRRSMGLSYDEIGSTYRRQGRYSCR